MNNDSNPDPSIDDKKTTDNKNGLIYLLEKRIEMQDNLIDRRLESAHSLWNSIISLNGIFLAFFTILSDKTLLSNLEIIIFGIITCFPILIILAFYYFDRHFSSKIVSMHSLMIQLELNLLKQTPNTKNQNSNHSSAKYDDTERKLRIFYKYQKIFEPIAIGFTVIAVFFIGYLLIAHKIQYC